MLRETTGIPIKEVQRCCSGHVYFVALFMSCKMSNSLYRIVSTLKKVITSRCWNYYYGDEVFPATFHYLSSQGLCTHVRREIKNKK